VSGARDVTFWEFFLGGFELFQGVFEVFDDLGDLQW
jgi:hypothetical protein